MNEEQLIHHAAAQMKLAKSITEKQAIKEACIEAVKRVRRVNSLKQSKEIDYDLYLLKQEIAMGGPIYTGPRGGRYRINDKGKRSYDIN